MQRTHAHGRGDTQFMNLALQFNPVVIQTVTISDRKFRQAAQGISAPSSSRMLPEKP